MHPCLIPFQILPSNSRVDLQRPDMQVRRIRRLFLTTRSFLPRLSLTASCATPFARTAQGYAQRTADIIISPRQPFVGHVGARVTPVRATTRRTSKRRGRSGQCCEGMARQPIFPVRSFNSLSLYVYQLLSTQPSACNLQSYKDRSRQQPSSHFSK